MKIGSWILLLATALCFAAFFMLPSRRPANTHDTNPPITDNTQPPAHGVDLSVLETTLPTHYPQAVRASVRRGLEYLMSQQQSDGAWRSTTFIELGNGGACTALALATLAKLPPAVHEACATYIEKGFAFLALQQNANGAFGNYNDSAGYPTYCTALALEAASALKPQGWETRIARGLDFLRTTQFVGEAWPQDNPRFGGWGLGRPGSSDHAEIHISTVAFVLEGLNVSGIPPQDTALQNAAMFIRRCQYDKDPDDYYKIRGGFHFSPFMNYKEKAEWLPIPDVITPRPYGSATADGLRSLLLCGFKPGDEPVETALSWLMENRSIERTPGFPERMKDTWALALVGYYYCTVSHALRLYVTELNLLPSERRSAFAQRRAWIESFLGELSGALPAIQGANGSWLNSSPLMWENDPLLSTCMILTAQAHCMG